MKKIITIILIIIFVCMFTACGRQETEEVESANAMRPGETEVADLIAYFGERPLEEYEEIPTYSKYLMSQERPHVSDFSGINHMGGNDSRRLFFKTKIEEVVAEYEENGEIKDMILEVEEIESDLYRVNPYLRIYLSKEECVIEDTPHNYVTFRIKTTEGKNYYMTWVPPTV